MFLLASLIAVVWMAGLAAFWWVRRERDRRLIEEHTISPEELHRLLDSEGGARLFDVRLPLEVLAYSEIIPGAVRITPKEIEADPTLIPKDVRTVVYCTCPGDETSREILRKALALGFDQTAILRGGLAGWKAKGYAVARYEMAFHLDTPV